MSLFTVDFFTKYVSNSDLTESRVVFIPCQNLSGDNTKKEATTPLASRVELTNVEIVILPHNRIRSTIFSYLFLCFPNLWWIDLSHNRLSSLEDVELPAALGSLDLRSNKDLKLENNKFPIHFLNCHLLRLSISPEVFHLQGDDLHDDWTLINRIITELPNVWVFNDDFISLQERNYVLQRKAIVSDAEDMSKLTNEWKYTQPTLRQLLILHTVQSLQFYNEKNDFQRLDILLEEYLMQALIFNQYAHHFLLNNNSKIKYIQYQPTIIYPDFLLLLPHKTRLDLSILLTMSVIFTIPEPIFKETLILLLSAYYPIEAIPELMYLPSFIKTALVSLLRRITKREQEEFTSNQYLRKKVVSPRHEYLQYLQDHVNFPIPTNYASPTSFHFLKNIKYYLEDLSIIANNAPASLLPPSEILATSLEFSDLEKDVLHKLPDIPTKWSKYRYYPSDEHRYTPYNIDYIPWMSFAARHVIFLFNKCPSCPPLTRVANNAIQQNLYFDLLPILKAAGMSLSDLAMTNYGPLMDGRKLRNLYQAMNIHPSLTKLNLNPEEKQQQLLEEMSDTTSLNPGDQAHAAAAGRSQHKSKRRQRLEAALLYLDGKILPYGEGLIRGTPQQLIWSKDEFTQELRNKYARPWDPSAATTNELPAVTEETEKEEGEVTQETTEEKTEQKTFFLTSTTNNNELLQNKSPPYKLAREYTDTLLHSFSQDSYQSLQDKTFAAGTNNPFLNNRPASIRINDLASKDLPPEKSVASSSPRHGIIPPRSPHAKPGSPTAGQRHPGGLSRHNTMSTTSPGSPHTNPHNISAYSSLWQSENFGAQAKAPEFFPPEFRPHSNSSNFHLENISSSTRDLRVSIQSQPPKIAREDSKSFDSYAEEILSGLKELSSQLSDEASAISSKTSNWEQQQRASGNNHRGGTGESPQSIHHHLGVSFETEGEDALQGLRLLRDNTAQSKSGPPTAESQKNQKPDKKQQQKKEGDEESVEEEMVIETKEIVQALRSSKSASQTLINIRKSIRESDPMLSQELLLESSQLPSTVEIKEVELDENANPFDFPDDQSLSDDSHHEGEKEAEAGPKDSRRKKSIKEMLLESRSKSMSKDLVGDEGNEAEEENNLQQQDDFLQNMPPSITIDTNQLNQAIPRNGKLHKVNIFSADLLLDSNFLLAPEQSIQRFNQYFKYTSLDYDMTRIDPQEFQNRENMLNYWRQLEKAPVVMITNKNLPLQKPKRTKPQKNHQRTFSYYINKKHVLKQTQEVTKRRQELLQELQLQQQNNKLGLQPQEISFEGTESRPDSPVTFTGTDFASKDTYDDEPSQTMLSRAKSPSLSAQPQTAGNSTTYSSSIQRSITSQPLKYRYVVDGDAISIDDSIALSEVTQSIRDRKDSHDSHNSSFRLQQLSSPGRSQKSSLQHVTEEAITTTTTTTANEQTQKQLSDSFLVAIQAIEDSDNEEEEEEEETAEGSKNEQTNQKTTTALGYQIPPIDIIDATGMSRPHSNIPSSSNTSRPIFSSTPITRNKSGQTTARTNTDIHSPFGREVLTPEAEELLRDMGTFRNISQLQAFNTFAYNLQMDGRGKIVDTMNQRKVFPHYQVTSALRPVDGNLSTANSVSSGPPPPLTPTGVMSGIALEEEDEDPHPHQVPGTDHLQSLSSVIDPNFDLHTISEKSSLNEGTNTSLFSPSSHPQHPPLQPQLTTLSEVSDHPPTSYYTANWQDSLLWLKNFKASMTRSQSQQLHHHSMTMTPLSSHSPTGPPAKLLSQSMPNLTTTAAAPKPAAVDPSSFFLTDVKSQLQQHEQQYFTSPSSRPVTEGGGNRIEFINVDPPPIDPETLLANQVFYQTVVDQAIDLNQDTKQAFATMQLRDQVQYPYIYTAESWEEHPMSQDLNFFHPKKKVMSFYPIFPKTVYKVQAPSSIPSPTALSSSSPIAITGGGGKEGFGLTKDQPETVNNSKKLKASKSVKKVPLAPAVLENDELSYAPSYDQKDIREIQQLYQMKINNKTQQHPPKGNKPPSKKTVAPDLVPSLDVLSSASSTSTHLPSKQQKNLQLLAETSPYFRSLLSEEDLNQTTPALQQQLPQGSFLSNLTYSIAGSDPPQTIAENGSRSEVKSQVLEIGTFGNRQDSQPTMIFSDDGEPGSGRAGGGGESYESYNKVPSSTVSGNVRPSSSSVQYIMSHLRQTLPATTPPPPIDTRINKDKQHPPVFTDESRHTTANTKPGIAEYSHDFVEKSLTKDRSGHRSQLPVNPTSSLMLVGIGAGAVTGSSNNSGQQLTLSIPSSSAKPQLIRPQYILSPSQASASQSNLLLSTSQPTGTDSAESRRSSLLSKPSSDIMYQLDNQAIYQSYYQHIQQPLSTISPYGHFTDESPKVSRQGSFDAPAVSIPAVGISPVGIVGGQASPLFNTSKKKSKQPIGDGRDEFFHRDPVVIKPHRRLRALTKEKKTLDHNHVAEENTVWAGMKNYRAATHKLPLNRSFRMKLPSLSQTYTNEEVALVNQNECTKD